MCQPIGGLLTGEIMEKHTLTFSAKSGDGQEFTIYEFTQLLDVGTFGNPDAVIEGLKRLETSEGQSVNRLEKGKYEIVALSLIIISDDKNAP